MITKRFTSPINRDDGTRHNFIGHARSEMRLEIHPDGLAATLQWQFEFIDGIYKGQSDRCDITLWFDRRKRLIDFDGVYELPVEAIEMLEDNGYNAEFAKQ
ncbi:MAG: hypothetical protein ACK4S4_16045 [Pyrinomonadaceae bacterium]